jgi:nitrous oxidase accessory protein NosD
VDAAQSGATIEIEEGEYAEQLVLSKPVTLKGLGTGPVIRSSGVLMLTTSVLMLLRVRILLYMCPHTVIYL